MKRFNEKIFLKTGIPEQLLKIKFIKDNKTFIFDSWYYENKFYYFFFKNEHEESKYATVKLYGQHFNNYINTINLIKGTFIKDNYKIMEV